MIAVLDANVLYPAPVRDLLLHLADAKLFQPKWSERIHQEWTRNLLLNRPDIPAESLQRTVAAMNTAFPDAMVAEDTALEESVIIPDPDDRHVVVTAILCNADWIITLNLKDFPVENLMQFNSAAIHPDDFVVALIDTDAMTAVEAFNKMVAKLKNPPKTYAEVLAALDNCGMPKTANLLS